ncbi:MAG: hypothetical protein PF541_18650 [Prolixibacteraceae bacterium]|nr:hypothetical protein [Prolixibacteraceae bacterium]
MGKFETIEFAKKGLLFLRKLGLTNSMIVEIENGIRVQIVL